MLEYVNEPVTVEVHLRPDGTVRPLAFVWRGQRYQIHSWGREGTETREGRTVHCYLVQTADLEGWELCQEIASSRWALVRRWARKQRAV
jgi:hypothetical protein